MKIVTLLLLSVMMMSPSATLFSSPQKDKPAEVDRAQQSLQTAKNELEHAGRQNSGHGSITTSSEACDGGDTFCARATLDSGRPNHTFQFPKSSSRLPKTPALIA